MQKIFARLKVGRRVESSQNLQQTLARVTELMELLRDNPVDVGSTSWRRP